MQLKKIAASMICVSMLILMCLPQGISASSKKANSSVLSDTMYTSKNISVSAAFKKSKPIIKIGTSTTNSIKISWKRLKGATRYHLYRATSKNGKYKKIVSTSALQYSSKKLASGKVYYFKLRAEGKFSGKLLYSSYSTVRSGRTKKAIAPTPPPAPIKKDPQIYFSNQPVTVEVIKSTLGFVEGTRFNYNLHVTDDGGQDSITIEEEISVPPSKKDYYSTLTQKNKRTIKINGPGVYPVTQTIKRSNPYYIVSTSNFEFSISGYNKTHKIIFSALTENRSFNIKWGYTFMF